MLMYTYCFKDSKIHKIKTLKIAFKYLNISDHICSLCSNTCLLYDFYMFAGKFTGVALFKKINGTNFCI